MASLLIYQLEADPESPDELLSNYEQEMNVYSILKDKEGHILFQSKPDTRTDLDTLIRIAEKALKYNIPQNKRQFLQSQNREDTEKSLEMTTIAIM